MPAQVVMVNLDTRILSAEQPRIIARVGDACQLPREVRAQRFDLVYSNSLLEHVGGHARRLLFAETVVSMAGHHWVQTPYRYFPIEPHWLFPGFQFLPARARVEVARRWPLGHLRARNHHDAVADVAWVELISATELRGYFPHSHIWRERFAGLPKSLTAIS